VRGPEAGLPRSHAGRSRGGRPRRRLAARRHARVDAALELVQVIGRHRPPAATNSALCGITATASSNARCAIGKAAPGPAPAPRRERCRASRCRRRRAPRTHKKRVAPPVARVAKRPDRFRPVPARPATALRRQRREPQPRHVRTGQFAEHDSQRDAYARARRRGTWATTKRREGIASAPEQPDDVERRVVGPMKILEHDEPSRRLAEARGRALAKPDRLGVIPASTSPRELPAEVGRRCRRAARVGAGREQRLRTPRARTAMSSGSQNASTSADLADARLAGDQNDPARAPDAATAPQIGREHGELLRTLQ